MLFVKSLQFVQKRKIFYEIPERYRNSFYLANASLFDQVNWYLHRAYQLSFPKLVSWLREQQPSLTENEAVKKITTVIKVLDQCNAMIDTRFPVSRQDGTTEMVRCFRGQYGLFSGFKPTLGGLRITENVTRDHIKGLSALANYKHACMGIRLAGSHGGIKVNPAQYSLDLETIVKKYAEEMFAKRFCDGVNDIIEPDINVSEREMSWIASVLPKDVVVAGKSQDLGGIENYSTMASQGAYFALDYFINDERVLERIQMKEGTLKNKTFIIQGLGNLGTSLAKYLDNSGALCVGIKEHDCYIYDFGGIDVQAAIDYKKQHNSLMNFSKAKPIANDEIFKEECDILVLAAQQKSLICYIADKVKAKIVVEAANGAITPTSHRILHGRSKFILPDVYVSSGHAIASYLEYLLAMKQSNREFPVMRRLYSHILDTVNSSATAQLVCSATAQKIVSCEMKPDVLTYATEHVMRETGSELLDICKEYNLDLDLRIAGYIKAIQSIHQAILEMKMY